MPKRSRKPENPKLPNPGPSRPPRVTDDDDDGLAGALVPKKPTPPILTGAAAKELPKPQKPPADPAQAAKSILERVTGKAEHIEPPMINEAARQLGRLGGLKGGKARAEALTPDERKASAKKAAEARWGTKDKG